MKYYLGIDVGTGSARAGIFDGSGTMAGSATREIKMWKPQTDFVEQSSDDIWNACCDAVKGALQEAGIDSRDIRGIGFDGTSSQVVLDKDARPVTVSPTGSDEQNVIVWMDHRAVEQADRINSTGHRVLEYVGGRISPEMGSPKLLWLKENMPGTWNRMARVLELPDFLTHRATGDDTRSLCTAVCKWTYLGHEESDASESIGRWDDSYWREIGLGEIVDAGYAVIGTHVRPMGEPIGNGLTENAARELGLAAGTPVSVSIIDAHAGGLGLLGAKLEGDLDSLSPDAFDRRLAFIGGTSNCLMAAAAEARFVPGVWGPYFSAMVPGMWLNEGGQTAAGSLVDHVILSHARAGELQDEAKMSNKTFYQILNERLAGIAQDRGVESPSLLTAELHVLPYFHGNRSPRADATLRGMISGLRLSDSADELALVYVATIQSLAYGMRHVLEEFGSKGYAIDTILACGGGTKNPVFLREHADITGCRIVLPREPEAVLLGSSMLGAVASGDFDSIPAAMSAMSEASTIIEPARGDVKAYHDSKYKVFRRMYDHQMDYRRIMEGET